MATPSAISATFKVECLIFTVHIIRLKFINILLSPEDLIITKAYFMPIETNVMVKVVKLIFKVC